MSRRRIGPGRTRHQPSPHPGPDQPAPQPLLPPLLAVLSLWRARGPLLGFGLAVSLLALACALALLSTAGLRLAGAAVGVLLIAAPVLRALGAGRVLLRYGERLLTHNATFRALADLRVWFFRRLAASAAGGLGFRRSGDALSRLVDDVETLDGLYLRLLVPLCGAVLILPVLALVLGAFAAPLALAVCALFALASFALPWLAARRSASTGAGLSQAVSGLRIAALDAMGGLREIRAFDAGGRTRASVASREAALLSVQADLSRSGAYAGGVAFLCGQAAILAVLAAALGVGFHRIGPLAAALCLFLLLAGFDAASGLVRAGALAGGMSHAASRVLEAGQFGPGAGQGAGQGSGQSSARSAARRAWSVPMPDAAGLRFEAVQFRWQPDRAPVFDGLTLAVPEGARIALLGPSGAGKSTLAALLLCIATPQSGRILLGDVDLARLEAEAVRARIAWLGQDTHLFDDSIRANLLLGRADADEAALWSALEQARIADFVRGLPEGLDGWLGESGARVSGGQGRRLALARALLSEAPILILDEPCAGLDADTERDFLATLNDLGAGRTMILIVHRLTGIERLDRIWHLRDGRAVAAA